MHRHVYNSIKILLEVQLETFKISLELTLEIQIIQILEICNKMLF